MIGSVLAMSGLIVMPALAGRAVRHVAGPSVAWAFGWLALALTYALLHWAQVPQPAAYAAVAILAIGGAVAGIRRPRRDWPVPRLWHVLIAAFAACLALETFSLPVNAWDAVAIWYPKARDLLLWRPPEAVAVPTYPDLGPAAWALMLGMTGLEREPLARLVFPALCVSWIASVPFLFEGVRRARRPGVIVVLFLIVVATFDVSAATSGYQDALIMSGAGLAAILLGRTLLHDVEPSPAEVTLGLFFAGCLGMIKAEGGVLGVIVVLSWIAAVAWTRGWTAARSAVPAAALVMFAGLTLLWPVLLHLSGLDVARLQGYSFEVVSAQQFLDGMSRLPAIARGFASVSRVYALVFLAAAAASLGTLHVAWTRPLLGWLWAVAALHMAWIVVIFVVTNVDLDWHIRTALERLVSQHSFVWVLALAVSAVALLDHRTASATRGSGPRPPAPGSPS